MEQPSFRAAPVNQPNMMIDVAPAVVRVLGSQGCCYSGVLFTSRKIYATRVYLAKRVPPLAYRLTKQPFCAVTLIGFLFEDPHNQA